MESVTVYVGGREVPIVKLSYEDIERAIQDWRIGGVTDPLGQLVAWLRDQVAALVGSLRDAILSALSSLVSSISSAISGAVSTIVGAIQSGIQTLASSLFSALSGAVSTISGVITSAIGTISSSVVSALGVLRDALTSLASSILNALSSVAGAISSALSSAVGVISSALSSMASSLSSMISSFFSTVVGAVQSIAGAINSAVSSIVSAISSAISGLASMISSAMSGITSALGSMAGAISSALSSLASAITGALNGLASRISDLISQLASRLGSMLKSVSDAIFSAIRGVMDAVGAIGRQIVSSFVGAFSALTSTLMSIFSNIVAGLQSVSTALQGFVNSIARLGDLIGGSLKQLVSALEAFFRDPVGTIAKALGEAWKSFVELTRPIWEPVKNFIDFLGQTVWQAVNEFINALRQGLDEFLRDPLGFIVRQITSLWSAFVEFTRPVWEPILAFFEGVGKFFQELWDQFVKALGGAWEAFVELTKPIWEPIQGFFDAVAKGFGEFLKDPLGFIVRQISSLWSGFVEFTRPIWEPILNFFGEVGKFFTDLLGTLGDWSKAVIKFLTEDIPNFFTKTLPKFLMEDLPRFLTEDLPKYLLEIGRKVLEGLQTLGEALLSAIKLVSELLMRAVAALMDIGRSIFGGLMQGLAEQAIRTIQESIKPGSPPPEIKKFVGTTYEAIMLEIDVSLKQLSKHSQVTQGTVVAAGTLAATIAAIVAGISAAGLAADIPHPFKSLGFGRLVKSMVDYMGGFFIMSSLSASFTFFVLHPLLRRFFQKRVRPVLPGPDTMTIMFFRNSIDQNFYKEHMAELGYLDTFINGFIDVNANIPTVEQMIKLVGAGLVEKEDALKQLKKAGWIGERGWLGAEVVFEGFKDPPPMTSALEMFWRGYIDESELEKIYMWHGRHERYFKPEVESQYKIPPISDLITFVVREVIDPADFKVLVRKQGFQPPEVIQKTLGRKLIVPLISGGQGEGDWADAYWEAHWRLPSPEQIFEFYNRAVVGMVSVEGRPFQVDPKVAEKVVMAYTTLHDYKPEIKELSGYLKSRTGLDRIPVPDETLVRSLRYRILTRIESRFVRRWGLVSTADYMRLGIAQGIDPYIKIKTLDGNEITMLEALTTAEFLQDLLEERTALRTQIINAFVKGFNLKLKVLYVKDRPGEVEEREIETLKLEDALKVLRFRPEEVSWLVAQALIRRNIELREDRMKMLTEDYVAGVIEPAEFETELKALIQDEEVRKSVVEFFTKKRVRERMKRSRSRLDRELLRELDTHLRLYESGFATKEKVVKLMDELIQKGLMSDEEKEILLSISESRRKRELVELALRALGKRVGRGEITPEEFISAATKLGVDKEFAEKLMEVNTPFHTLSVGALISYADEVPIPEALLEKKLKVLRVPADEAEIIKAVARRRPIADEIRSIASMLQSLARDLEVTPEEAGTVLRGLGFTEEEVKLRTKIVERLNTLAIKRQIRRTLDVLLREQFEALSKGEDPRLITLRQYYEIYKKMGYPDEFIVSRAQEILANFKMVTDEWRNLKMRLETGR